MHASTDVRIVKCVDGLHYSFEILRHVYEPLYDICKTIPADNAALVETLWRCWSFVDTLHRVREVTQAMPGLNTKDVEVRTFLNRTSVIEQYRHYIQHLRSELSKKDPNPFPVWGSLSWVDPDDPFKTHLVLAGARIGTTSYSGCVFDMRESKWVSKVSLGAEGLSLNFDPLYEATVEFRDFILPWAFSTFKPGIKQTSQLPIITTILRIVDTVSPAPINDEA